MMLVPTTYRKQISLQTISHNFTCKFSSRI